MSTVPPDALSPTLDAAPPDPAATVGLSDPAVPPTGAAPDGVPVVPGFVIEGELGRGAMGVVYKARQLGLNRPVALKLILAGGHAGAEHLERFRREAEAAARLQHPNVVQVFAVGSHDGRPYLALEYVEGGSLDKHLKGTPLPPRDAATLIETLARAMQHAHERGIVHRDLKPANVLLSAERGARSAELPENPGSAVAAFRAPRSAFRAPKIADFGLAKALDADAGQTRSGDLLGTPSYMAPEQARGDAHKVGPAADVWALGVILYECLTGRGPFKAADLFSTLDLVEKAEPVPVRQLQPGVPRDLETIALHCLQKEPGRRYPSAQALADDLGRFLRGEPITARPVGAAARAWKWCRRRPAVAGLLAALVLLGAGSLAGLTALYLRAEGQRQDAEAARERAELAERAQRAEAGRAQAAEQDARAFADFLVEDVLAAARQEGVQAGQGLQVTVAEAIHKAAPAVAAKFAGRPAAEAAVRHSLGVTLRHQGEEAAAAAQLEQAVALRRQALGPHHPDTLESMNSLAITLRAAGRTDESVALHEQLYAHYRDHAGPDAPATLFALNNLALACQDADQAARVLPPLEAALARLGPGHPDTLPLRESLGVTLAQVGRHAEAVAHLEQVLPALRDQQGADYPGVLFAMTHLAMAYEKTHRLPEAIRLLAEVYQRRLRAVGADHPMTLMGLHNLADAHAQAGHLSQAIPLFEEALRGRRARLGPANSQTLATLFGLADAYYDADRPAEAIPLYRELHQERRTRLGPDASATLFVLNRLGLAFLDAGRLADAIPVFEETLARRRATVGPDHPATLFSLHNLANVYRKAGRPGDAIPLFEAALQGRRAKLGADHALTLRSQQSLALALCDAGRHARAEPVLADLLAVQRRKLADDSPAVAVTLTTLGECRIRLGRFADAEPVLLAAVAGPRRTEARALLVQLYAAWGKPAEADRWRAALVRGAVEEDWAWALAWGRPGP